MTVKELTPKTSETDVAEEAPQAPALNIKQAIQKSTSEVKVSDLQKKGFKQVKVLNKQMITRLIHQAVDRVISSRAETISKEERQRVIEESQNRLQELAKEKSKLEHELGSAKLKADKAYQRHEKEEERLTKLTDSVTSLTETVKEREKEVEELKRNLSERDRQIEELKKQLEEGTSTKKDAFGDLMVAILEKFKDQNQATQQTTDISKLQNSIEGLVDRISNMSFSGGGGGGDVGVVNKEVILERLFSRDDGEDMESNVSNVKVKEAKASGVNSTLNKLKALQQGGTKDGE